nr:MAG TPA: hypothetical protein [Caudoviricetes sp.]
MGWSLHYIISHSKKCYSINFKTCCNHISHFIITSKQTCVLLSCHKKCYSYDGDCGCFLCDNITPLSVSHAQSRGSSYSDNKDL